MTRSASFGNRETLHSQPVFAKSRRAKIIINLLLIPGYFDVALRDVGLMIGALALGRLSHDFDN